MEELHLDLAGCLSSRLGNDGLEDAALESAGSRIADLTKSLDETRGAGWERWRLLPHPPMRDEHLSSVRELVERYRPGCENLIVLGIGGSALGNIAIQSALNPSTHNLLPAEARNGPRIFVLDNVDPALVGSTLELVRSGDPGLEKTVVNVISKSGETAETAAQFLIVRSMLRSVLGDKAGERMVAITDPEKGTMRSICDAEGIPTLPVPEGVGGRFSVLSPVGLFSAAMCGIDIEALLDGAAAMDDRCRRPDIENPAAALAWVLMSFVPKGKSNHVLMPYSNRLLMLADWYRQLWAESLGKREDRAGHAVHAGATPIKALGATDQHSQIQLYREGPNDKVIGFVEVESFEDDLTIPSDLDVDALRYLHGRTLGELLNAEKRATEFALVESERPNYTIRMPVVDAHTVGQFIWLWQMATAYAGLMLGIDAYNQPAVETGKKATFGLMGRAGYESYREEVDRRLGAPQPSASAP